MRTLIIAVLCILLPMSVYAQFDDLELIFQATSGSAISVTEFHGMTKFGDLNGDSIDEVYVTIEPGAVRTIFSGDDWSPLIEFTSPPHVDVLGFVDFDHNGIDDLVILNENYTLEMYRYIGPASGIPDGSASEISSRLLLTMPNPSQGVSEVLYQVSKAGEAEISLFDVSGRLVAEIVSPIYHDTGQYRVSFPQSVSSGVYFLRFVSSGVEITTKTVVVK
ncbi:MAG: T9SS type A sorting domain-containing protein [Patescibacteria group bacterium]